jgi:hypothetical protein
MFSEVRYNGKKYRIMTVYFKKHKIPVLVDANNERLIRSVGEKWNCNSSGVITCPYQYGGNTYDVKLHELVIAADAKRRQLGNDNLNDTINEQNKNKTILHIDKLGLDNRIENLMYDTQEKDITKNMKKKQRIVVLPSTSGISPDELPTYVWYIKPEGTHGERFIVNVGDIIWKTTSSRKVSLRYKLEEAKAYLRKLKQEQPDLFKSYSMNGDYNKAGEKLLESFYDIIYKAGFDNIKKISLPNATDKYLLPHQLESALEKKIFNANVLERNIGDKKGTIKMLPSEKSFKIGNLPDNCYYRPESAERGDHFVVKNHPKYIGTWSSSTSKNVKTIDKYKQLCEFLKTLQ